MPTPGVPSTRPISMPNAEAYDQVSKLGVSRALGGIIYNQFGNTASINTTTTQASVFNESVTTSYGSRILPASFFSWFPRYYDSAVPLPGGYVCGKIWGTIANNTSTPNVTILVGLTVAGAFRAVASTGATAMISTATVAVPFECDFWLTSRVLGAAAVASIIGGVRFSYFVTSIAPNIWGPVTAGGCIEITNMVSTVENIIDVQMLWGTSHANNAFVAQGAIIEALG